MDGVRLQTNIEKLCQDVYGLKIDEFAIALSIPIKEGVAFD